MASLRSDVTAPTVRSAGEAGYVNTLGWRMDYQALWGVHPRAQVSYNQSLASDVWAPMTRAVEGGWSDVTRALICGWDPTWRHGQRCRRRITCRQGKYTLFDGGQRQFLIGNCYAFETMWLLLNLSNGAFL